MICNTILDAVGNTPLVRLNRLPDPDSAEILVKFEAVNVGGSIKTRTALNMLNDAENRGVINKDSIIVEPTSGNQGIGLALAGAVKGLKVVIIMPDSVSVERRKLVQQYGAEVVLVHDDGDIGKCIEECLATAMEMAAKDPNVFVPQQFENPANNMIHITTTAVEIIEQTGKEIHGFCSGFGTGGTISGIGNVLREHYPDVEIWAIEPDKAAILSGGEITTHSQMGIGDGLIPGNLDTGIIDELTIVTDEEAFRTARALAAQEGMLCGVSGGSNVVGALRLAKKLGPGKTVVTILPDTGERYFSTELFK